MTSDPYKVLGVSPNASDDEIQKAYRRLVKKYHPDVNPGDENAEKKMREINAAYDQIRNIREGKASYGGQNGNPYGDPYGNAETAEVIRRIFVGRYIRKRIRRIFTAAGSHHRAYSRKKLYKRRPLQRGFECS